MYKPEVGAQSEEMFMGEQQAQQPRAGRMGWRHYPVLTMCVSPAPRQSCDLALLAADEPAHHGKPHSEPRLLIPGSPVSPHLLPHF